MSITPKHRPSEVLLQLMRFTWDPTFQAADLDITMGEAMEVYRATIEMETRMETSEKPKKSLRRGSGGAAVLRPGRGGEKTDPCAAYGALCRPRLRHRGNTGGGHGRRAVRLGHFAHEGTGRRPDVRLARP